MNGLLNELKFLVEEVIERSECQYCHPREAAEILAAELDRTGISAKVVDGFVVYDGLALGQERSRDNFLLEGENVSCSRELQITHSWCELPKGDGKVIIIDYHPENHASSYGWLKGKLLVEYYDQSPHRYCRETERPVRNGSIIQSILSCFSRLACFFSEKTTPFDAKTQE